MMELNIFICGIGGQGVVFLGSFLRNYFLCQYPDGIILGTESRGVSQREGSVVASVRIQTDLKNQNVFSPEIPPMMADIVIALEPLELLRNFHMIHKNTLIITNNEPIIPKSSVQWMMKESSDKNSTNIKNYSNPEWVMEKIQGLVSQIPNLSNRKMVFLKDKLSIKKEVDSEIISYSRTSNLYDVNFSSIILDELENSSNLNLVVLGFATAITESWLEIKSLKKFIQTNSYIRERNKKENLIALDFGSRLLKSLH